MNLIGLAGERGGDEAIRNVKPWTRQTALLLLFLSMVHGIQYIDQLLPGLLAEQIKMALRLSDTQLGFITGPAFIFLYVTLGIPIARLSDRLNRKYIIIISLCVFSLATTASGLAMTFVWLVVARAFVAIGEAGTMPAIVSMIGDSFPVKVRTLAMSLWGSGAFVGTGLGLLLVAAAGPFIYWRTTFDFLGLIGLAIAVFTLLLVREPRRVAPLAAAENSLRAIKSLVSLSSFRWTAISLAFAITASTSAMSWVAPFLSRSHGMTTAHTMMFLAVVWGLGGTCGTTLLGMLTNWIRSHHGPGLTAIVVGCIVIAFSGFYCLAFWTGSVLGAMVGVFTAVFFLGGVRGPTFALLQDITLNSRHATANALAISFAQLFGAGLGPLVVGIISDAARPTLGAESLRIALFVVVSASGILGALSMFMAARSVKADMPALPASAYAQGHEDRLQSVSP